MVKVYLKFNQVIIKEFALTKPETTFGRKESNDIRIDNPAISGTHGKIVKENDSYFVVDLNSTNGIYLNGRPIKKEKIKNRDQIRLARHILEFCSDEEVQKKDEEESKEEKKPAPQQKPQEEEKAPSKAPAPGLSQAMDDLGFTQETTKIPTATIKVISGEIEGADEVKLTTHVTYIGSGENAAIRIKGFMAPSLAAAITRKNEGYFLKAVKRGYPKVNGEVVKDQVLLQSGALIEVGSTNILFTQEEPPKKPEAFM